jgi:hypothetical protein
VDFDGDGHRNMIKSSADALASAANYMKYLGWQAGQPWLEEVEVPDQLPWEQADVTIKHPRSQWAKWGVTKRGGGKLRADNLPASLILPMGKNGPGLPRLSEFRRLPDLERVADLFAHRSLSRHPLYRCAEGIGRDADRLTRSASDDIKVSSARASAGRIRCRRGQMASWAPRRALPSGHAAQAGLSGGRLSKPNPSSRKVR